MKKRSLIIYIAVVVVLTLAFGVYMIAEQRHRTKVKEEKDIAAREYLQQAVELIDADKYNAAKLMLDSVDIYFPRNIDARTRAAELKDSISEIERQRSKQYADSMTVIATTLCDEMIKKYYCQKKSKYEDIDHYSVRSKEEVLKNILARAQGCGLYAEVDEQGEVTMQSICCNKKLHHTMIQLSAGDYFDEGKGRLHSFTDDNQYEILSLNHEESVGMLQFVNLYQQETIKVTLQGNEGKKQFSYTLNEADKRDLIEVYRLYIALSDRNKWAGMR